MWIIKIIFNLLGYSKNICIYSCLQIRPKRTGFNVYAEYTRPQWTFLPLHAWLKQDIAYMYGKMLRTGILGYCVHYKYTRILFKGISTILFFFDIELTFILIWMFLDLSRIQPKVIRIQDLSLFSSQGPGSALMYFDPGSGSVLT